MRRPSSERRCRWCSAKTTGARCRLPACRPCWICPTGRRRPTCRISAGSTSRSSGCRWISASPIGQAPALGRARCARSSGSVPTTMPSRWRRAASARRPTSATCRYARASASMPRSRISRRSMRASVRPGCGRFRSAATTRSPIRSSRGWGTTARSGSSISTPIATRWARSTAPSSTMAGRSAKPCWPVCSTRSGRSRSASAARPKCSGASPTTPG